LGKLTLLIEEPYNSDVVSKILLIAGISPNSEVVYAYIILFSGTHTGVKITTTRGQPAGVRSKYTCSEASQRLYAGDLSPFSSFYLCLHVRPCVYFYSNRVARVLAATKRCFLTKSSVSLPSSYISGVSEGESTFVISITKNSSYKSGYQVKGVYSTQLHINDLALLEQLKAFFLVLELLQLKRQKFRFCYICGSVL
jgi:hypothetical protein